MRHRHVLVSVTVLGIACAHAVTVPETPMPVVPADGPPTLARLAGARHFELGAAVQGEPLLADSAYANAVVRDFTMVSTENALKFGPLRPSPEQYDFSEADAIVRFAETHALRVRGHTLVWKRQLPAWLTGGTFMRNELITILREHIDRKSVV